jgi:hypothetical protein
MGLSDLRVGELPGYIADRMEVEQSNMIPSIEGSTLRVTSGTSRRYGWSGVVSQTSCAYTVCNDARINRLKVESLLVSDVIGRMLTQRGSEATDTHIEILRRSANWDSEADTGPWLSESGRLNLIDQPKTLNEQLAEIDIGSIEIADTPDNGDTGLESEDTSSSGLVVAYDSDDEAEEAFRNAELEELTRMQVTRTSAYEEGEDTNVGLDVFDDVLSLGDFKTERKKSRGLRRMEGLGEINSFRLASFYTVKRRIPEPDIDVVHLANIISSSHVIEKVQSTADSFERLMAMRSVGAISCLRDLDTPMPAYLQFLTTNKDATLSYIESEFMRLGDRFPLTRFGSSMLIKALGEAPGEAKTR